MININKIDMEIKEGNKLIAEFMGYHRRPDLDDEILGEAYYIDSKLNFYTSKCKYHSSWDWLMPVIEKIEQTKYTDYSFNYNITGDGICISKFDDGSGVIHSVSNKWGESKLDASWKCVVEFIKWYNPLIK